MVDGAKSGLGDGLYERRWVDRGGAPKVRVMLVRNGAALDLRHAEWRSLDFFKSLGGNRRYLGPIPERHATPEEL